VQTHKSSIFTTTILQAV